VEIGRSLTRFVAADGGTRTVSLPPGTTDQEIALSFRPQELERIDLEASGRVTVRTQQPVEGFALEKKPDVDLDPETGWSWQRAEDATSPFLGQRPTLVAVNRSDRPVDLTIRWRLVPEFPQAAILPWTTAVLVTLAAAYAAFRLGARRTAAVAAATTKEAIGQPVFAVALIAGAVLLFAFIVIPYNTFGEDVKMLKDSGLTLIKVLALLVFLILGGVLLATTSLKVVYDAREGAKVDPLWKDCAEEMITVVPGLALALLETILLAAVSLAVSTRLGMVPNLIICFTVYALGHLVPLIVQSSVGKFAIVRFVGKLFATVLPVLEHFTIDAAVAGGVPVPWSYLGWAAVYAGLYSAVALLVALVLFQDRDLA
jgi:hypothetical protein